VSEHGRERVDERVDPSSSLPSEAPPHGPAADAPSSRPAPGPDRPADPSDDVVEPEPVRVSAAMFRRAALTPRMLGLLLVFLVIAAVCARLGVWQLDRAVQRAEINEAARVAQQEQAPATPLGEVLAPRQTFPGDLVGTKVRVTGRFDGETLLVPGRAGPTGEVGYLVLDRFRVTDDGAPSSPASQPDPDAAAAEPGVGGALGVLPVVRGWVAEPSAPPPAPGDVTVQGFLQAGESFERADLPEGQLAAIAPGQLVNLWGGPLYTGYLVVSDPVDIGVERLPPPTIPGGGLNLQNLAYALQWWIFGGFAVLLWSRLVRDEARADAEERADAAGGGAAPE
jgi:cytochrome oxidase assembly protein ShyY1